MRIAVPLFGQDIAPRFGYADRFIIADVAEDSVVRIDEMELGYGDWPYRLGRLKKIGVDTVLCGGFNRFFLPLAEDLGIEVVAGLRGKALKEIEAFLNGETSSVFPSRRMRRRKRGNSRCAHGKKYASTKGKNNCP